MRFAYKKPKSILVVPFLRRFIAFQLVHRIGMGVSNSLIIKGRKNGKSEFNKRKLGRVFHCARLPGSRGVCVS
jgi:hypothetical protein